MMILWHQSLIHWLDNKNLKMLHLNCCRLRSGRINPPSVNFIKKHDPVDLILYHEFVMAEMGRRGFSVNPKMYSPEYTGNPAPFQNPERVIYDAKKYNSLCKDMRVKLFPPTIFPEHDARFLDECIALLELQGADMSLICYAVSSGVLP